MLSKKLNKRVIMAAVVFLLCCSVILFFAPLTAQQEAKREYVPLQTGVTTGTLPKINVMALRFDAKIGKGNIPIDIAPQGFWKSQAMVEKTAYDRFEFDVKEPASLNVVGEPNVPIQAIQVDIPPDAQVDTIDIKSELIKTVDNVALVPNQKPLPINQDFILEKPEVTINQAVYKQTNPYPGKFYEIVASGISGDRQVLILHTYPVQYIPASKQAKFYNLSGVIKLKVKAIEKLAAARSILNQDEIAMGVKVHNKGDASQWKPVVRRIESELRQKIDTMHKEVQAPLPLNYPVLIICADLFYCPAKQLAAYHTSKGKPTLVVRAKAIDMYIPGVDTPDKMRKYIKVLYTFFNTRWVILFGDVSNQECGFTNVPTRMVKDPSPYGGVDDGKIPCDYYFACIDGTWDGNNNGIYGEIADQPDLFPELAVGRLAPNNLDDAYRIVNRIVTYTPPAQRKALLVANDLGWWPPCYEKNFKQGFILPVIQPFFSTIYQLYQCDGTLTLAGFVNLVNTGGISLIQYFGHGSPTSTQLMNSSQVASLINSTPYYPVFFALSCSTCRYDNMECFGEAWADTAKASYIGSTRVAYGGGQNSGEGLDTRFMAAYPLVWNTGYALNNARVNHFISHGWNTIAIKTILEFTLLGDPVMLH